MTCRVRLQRLISCQIGLALLLLVTTSARGQLVWESGPELPIALRNAAAVTDHYGNIYVIGGRAGMVPSADVFMLEFIGTADDPQYADEWVEAASLSVARSDLAVVYVGGFIYAAGGYSDGDVHSVVERYDTLADSPEWETIASLNTARLGAGITTDRAGRIHVVGGHDADSNGLASVEMWDPMRPEQGWVISDAELNTPRLRPGTVTDDDGVMYAIGGQGDNGVCLDSVELYDPTLPVGEWHFGDPISAGPNSNTDPAVKGKDGRIYLVGGWVGYFTNRAVRYDPKENSWERITDLPDALAHAALVLGADSYVYVIGGETTIHVPTANVWRLPTDYCRVDPTGDGMVSVEDLLELLGRWGVCP